MSSNLNPCTTATSRLRSATARQARHGRGHTESQQSPRAGKITRLPVKIREELNERLFEGELGPEILAWLNGLPEARKVLDTHFEGAEITKQNLSQWRHSGYQDWLAKREQRETLELMARGADRVKALKGQLAEQPAPKLADVMALQRTLIFLLMSKAHTQPDLLAKVIRMTKPLIQFAELETKGRKVDLAKRKYQHQMAERERAIEAKRKEAEGGKGLTKETLEQIERELHLFGPEPSKSMQVQYSPKQKEPDISQEDAEKTEIGNTGMEQSDGFGQSATATCEALIVVPDNPSESKQVQDSPGEKEPISETDVWRNLDEIRW